MNDCASAAKLVMIGENATQADSIADRCALVIGNFDGVHLGHQAVLREAVAEARDGRLSPCVLTFEPHPSSVVGSGAPPMLTTLERRAELMGTLGIERVYVRKFDDVFAAWTAERFAEELVAGALQARAVVVGRNFRFGAKRRGDLALLGALGTKLGFKVRVHEIARDAFGQFSSSRARDAIAAGNLDEIERVLGRPHSLSGTVVRGDERGRTLNFPTANLGCVPEILPPDGVYAVTVDILDKVDGCYRPLGHGVTNIGVRPTFAAKERTVETFILDFSGDLYKERIRLHLRHRLREEKRFQSLNELKDQIVRDVADARARLRK
jgi:riboflavin kinase/FMN adenylyltransferase